MARVGQTISPEQIKQVETAWAALIAEVQAARARGVDPASPEAQALGARWSAQTRELHSYYAGDPKLWKSIRNKYATNAYEDVPQAPTADDLTFIQSAIEAGRGA